jgi:hypothetical protein
MSVKHRVDDLAAMRKDKMQAELDELDKRLIRPLAEIASGTATDDDHLWLAELKEEKERLRAKLHELTGK